LRGANWFGLTIQHTDINPDSATVLLQVPELEKNWLISPPGSPPVGWQQIREDPPNRTVLPHDLSHALMSLNDELEDDFKLDADAEFEAESMDDLVAESSPSSSSPQVYVICKDEGHDVNGHELPHITVQDWDGGAQHHNLEQYRRIHRKVAPTAMPPRSNADKAPSLADRPPTPMHLMR
jgi:Calcipressin